MAFRQFNPLQVPEIWEKYFTKYPQGMTILESLFQWIKQVDEMSLNVNEWNTYLKGFVEQFDKELQETITSILMEWQESGFLDVIIDEALQTQMDVLEAETQAKLTKFENNLEQIITLNVKDFGAKGDKVTDDTQNIQTAINQAQTMVRERLYDGVQLFFPKGTYLISSTLTVTQSGVSLHTDNPSTGLLYAVNPDFDFVFLDGSLMALYHTHFNLGILAEGGASLGTGLKAHRLLDSKLDIYMNGIFNGLELDGCGRLFIDRLLIKQETRTIGKSNYFLDFKGNIGINSDIHITELNFHQIKTRDNAYNFSIRCVDGLYVGNAHINGALIFQPSNGNFEKTLASVFFDTLYVDGSTAENIIFTGSADNYRNIKFGKLQCRNGAKGMAISTTSIIDLIQIGSFLIYDQLRTALEFINDNCKSLQIGNLIIKDANSSQQAAYGYLLIGGENTQISNLMLIGETGIGYGLNVRSSAKNTQLGNVNMNRFTRTTQSVLMASFLGANTTVEAMSGVVNFVEGDIVIPVGETTLTVTHTIGVIYNNKDILITPRTFGLYKISNVTATTFDISIPTALTEPYYAGYQIHKRRFN